LLRPGGSAGKEIQRELHEIRRDPDKTGAFRPAAPGDASFNLWMSIDFTNPPDPTLAYLTGQLHPSQAALLADFSAESDATLASLAPRLDIKYGAHEREVFDLYISPHPWRGTLAYFHAGFWQSRDKAQFRFFAPAFLAQGIDVALVNYPLCPDVSLRRLVEATRASVPAILWTVHGIGRGGAALVAAGHSAGGHIAVELALTDWAQRGLPLPPVAGVLAISGVYELAPLLATRLNEKLQLNPVEARAMSPLHRVAGALPPAIFIAGGLETPEFRAQSAAMHLAWQAAAGVSSNIEIPGADHFSVLRALAAGGAAFQPAMALFNLG
jgi:arylformamidase